MTACESNATGRSGWSTSCMAPLVTSGSAVIPVPSEAVANEGPPFDVDYALTFGSVSAASAA